MNKKLLISLVAIVVIGCLIAGYFIFFHNNPINTSDTEEKDNWLRVSSVSELEGIAKRYNKKIEIDQGDCYIADLPIGSKKTTYGYSFDSDGRIVGLNIGVALVSSSESSGRYLMEKVTPNELRERIQDVLNWVSDNLNVGIGSNYYILSEEGGMLSVGDELSYKKILDGAASLDLRILDVDSSVWVMEVFRVQGFNVISCTLSHYQADSEEAQQPCYVAVNQ